MTTHDSTASDERTAARGRPGLRTLRGSRRLRVLAALLVQVLLLVGAVWTPLVARATGTQVRMRVGLVDPVDPFRGAYVALGYPDLPRPSPMPTEPTVSGERTAYVPLQVGNDGFAKGGPLVTQRPTRGLYLTCVDRTWTLSCGIESWFVGQDRATGLEQAVRDGTAVATVRVDARGNAALVGLAVR